MTELHRIPTGKFQLSEILRAVVLAILDQCSFLPIGPEYRKRSDPMLDPMESTSVGFLCSSVTGNPTGSCRIVEFFKNPT